MISHAQLSANLLRDAAVFFRTIGDQNPPLKIQMDANANTFEAVADLVERDPSGEITQD